MHAVSTITALATLASVATATNGFNYASTNGDGSGKDQATFEADFKAAQNLPGTNSQFNSARLYTMIQGGTASDPISAIPAAIATDTTLLLGLWASAGDASFDLELKALQAAIDTYGDKLKDVVVGISIGSEDLYRITPTSQASSPNPGAQPDTIVSYISKVRELIKGTVLSDAKLGHVDTWTAWANSSNNAVIEAVDWLGFDGYPYFQDGDDNGVENGKALFDESVEKTKAAAGGKPVWITETGWPVSGSTYNKAVASVDNAEVYWQTVGCSLFNVENVWWYILSDSGSTPEFGVIKSLDSEPYYNLTCDASSTSSSSSASASATGSSTATGSASSATHTGKSSILPYPTSAASNWTSSSTSQPGAASGSSSVSNIAPYPTGSSSSSSGSNSTSSGHASTTGSSSSSGNSTSGSAATTGSASGSTPSTITSSATRLTSVGVTVAAIAAAFAMI